MNADPEARSIERLRRVLAAQLGLSFEEARRGALLEALATRIGATELSAEAYLDRLEQNAGADELAALAQLLTVPESHFFRHRQHFEALRSILGATASKRAPTVLSAGCATGEEAYSLAIVLRDIQPPREPGILAVDLNPRVIARAREGRYSAWSLRETPEHVVARWFQCRGRDYVVDPELRRGIVFAEANLSLDDVRVYRREAYDAIFCRNVLMYFTPDKYRETVARLARALVPGGHLFLGSAETLRGVSDDFELCQTHDAFYYRRKPQVAELRAPAGPPRFESPPGAPRGTPGVEASATGLPAAAPDEQFADDWVSAIGRAAARVHALANAAPKLPVAPSELGPRQAAQRSARRRTGVEAALDLLYREQYADALEVLRRLPHEAALDPEALLLEAVLLASAGKLEDAEQACARLLAVDELNAGAHYVLGLCNAGKGRLDAAAQQDRIATHLDPEFAMAHLHLGLMLRRSGDRAGARVELSHARALLEREQPSRLALFGGGFGRSALLELCAAELILAGGEA